MYINYQESPITEREDAIAMQSRRKTAARRVERRAVVVDMTIVAPHLSGWRLERAIGCSQHASWWR
jgi:hypothetical protein